MAPDLRVKAVVRPPRRGEQSDGEEAVDSDEEWVESSAKSSSTASSTSKQRRSGASDRLQATQNVEQRVVIAPPPEKTEFDSWGAFDVYLKAYSAETYQSFRVRTNNKVASRNNKIRDSGSTKPLVPEEWVHYSKTFVCTHAGKYKPRGQGKRKRQESRALEYDVQINACVQAADSAAAVPTFVLRITAPHNHSLSRHTFDHYPHNRTAIDPELAGTVSELVKAGAKKKRILQFIHENSSCIPTSQYVHNLVRKLKKQTHTAQTSAKRLKQWMAESQGGVATLFKHSDYGAIFGAASGRDNGDDLSGENIGRSCGTRDARGGVSQQNTASRVVTDTSTEIEAIPSGQVNDESQGVSSASSVEITRVCATLPDLTTGGDDLGAGGHELGADGDGLGAGGHETGTEAENVCIESDTPHETEDHNSRLALAILTDDFQIMSPPKARGRPKQKPRVVKAKRNQAIAMVQEDLVMHERQMNLLT
ncbi:LOW QUALITY PROTEIN: hypothetical protein PHPALM_29844, partial [Phytophthora palmivora]